MGTAALKSSRRTHLRDKLEGDEGTRRNADKKHAAGGQDDWKGEEWVPVLGASKVVNSLNCLGNLAFCLSAFESWRPSHS
jgi:hypothetical protein